MSSIRRRRRFGLLVMALALAPALLACADVERTVTLHTVEQDDRGQGVRVVAWESDHYPDHVARTVDDACWASAVGEPVPEACLTASVLSAEANPFRQAPWIAGAGTILALCALLFLAWKQVGWQPAVESTTEGAPALGTSTRRAPSPSCAGPRSSVLDASRRSGRAEVPGGHSSQASR